MKVTKEDEGTDPVEITAGAQVYIYGTVGGPSPPNLLLLFPETGLFAFSPNSVRAANLH